MEITLKDRKFRLVACSLCLIAFGIGLVACKQEAKSQPQHPFSEEKCEYPVVINLDGVVFSVPRKGTSLKMKSGEQIYKLEKKCDQIKFENVAEVRLAENIKISTVLDQEYFTTYRQYYKKIREFEKGGLIETLPNAETKSNSMKKITDINSEIYIMSAPTGDDAPVVFHCNNLEKNRSKFLTERCYTSYVLVRSVDLIPTKLLISYDRSRRLIPRNGFMGLDEEIREKIDGMIVSKERG